MEIIDNIKMKFNEKNRNPKSLILDACVWITLAGEPDLYKLIESLADALNSTEFTLILPKSVEIEFNRHRESRLKFWEKKFNSGISLLKDISKHLLTEKENILKLQASMHHAIKSGTDQIQTNIDLIEKLFEKSITIDNLSSVHMAEAARRVFERITPASNPEGSSVGDCLLWQVVLDLLEQGEVWLCTENKHDFSMVNRHDTPHIELDNEAFKKNSQGHFNYFIELDKLINSILPYKKELPRYSEYTWERFEPATIRICPRCQSVNLILQLMGPNWRYRCVNCGFQMDAGLESPCEL